MSVVSDFDYLQDSTAVEVVEQAARAVYSDYQKYVELDDLVQEAHVAMATKADNRRALKDGDYGILQHRIEMDLINAFETTIRRGRRNVYRDEFGDDFDGEVSQTTGVERRLFSNLTESGFRGGYGDVCD